MNIKKLLLTSFFCLLLSACSFGQGQKENTASEFQSKTLFAMDTSMQVIL